MACLQSKLGRDSLQQAQFLALCLIPRQVQDRHVILVLQLQDTPQFSSGPGVLWMWRKMKQGPNRVAPSMLARRQLNRQQLLHRLLRDRPMPAGYWWVLS